MTELDFIFEERAAIMEFDGKTEHNEAEIRAMYDTLKNYKDEKKISKDLSCNNPFEEFI